MNANAAPLLAVFEKKMRIDVPLFQRQYVWSREQQWELLWEDIVSKFSEYLDGRKDGPVHFLGAMVLDQKQTPTTHVEKRQVIDGQQRLTTLQIFLAAFRDFCKQEDCLDISTECETFTLNKGMMADPKTDQFKVWPTQADRQQFQDVILSGSREELIKRHPLVFRKYARKPEPRPRMVEAYLYFFDELQQFFNGVDSDFWKERPVHDRLEDCLQALRNGIQVVVIDLEKDDDAQVIFETLNARGEPLLPADLLRNYIFLRASRNNEPQEELYDEYWRPFDSDWWRQEVKQGRLNRPRSDLFLQHYLASIRGTDIPIKHLFVEYKDWISHKTPFKTVRAELEAIASQGEDFRRIISPDKKDLLFPLASFLDAFDVRTAYPLFLALLRVRVPDKELEAICSVIESYLLRRSICGLTTKNYNRIFLQLTKSLESQPSVEAIKKQLSEMKGDSVEWPTNEVFETAWLEKSAYENLNNPKIVHILRRLNDSYYGPKNESISIESSLTIEHLMPQGWVENWPLKDGSVGLTFAELLEGSTDEARINATRSRNAMIHTLGNLTILTQELNSSVSNAGWTEKKDELLQASLLPLNLQLQRFDTWDEDSIQNRGRELLGRAVKLWPR